MLIGWITFVLASGLLILYFLTDEGHLSWRVFGRVASASALVLTVIILAALP